MRAENIITTARSRLWWSGGETHRSVETIKDGYDYVLKLKVDWGMVIPMTRECILVSIIGVGKNTPE